MTTAVIPVIRGGAYAAPVTKGAGRVFWSGRQGANREAAEAFAQRTGRETLEMTSSGQALEAAGGNISQFFVTDSPLE